MKITIEELLDRNEMLSHIFLECVPLEQLKELKKSFSEEDWKNKSTRIEVDLKIGGIEVDPKKFFNLWKDQMNDLIKKEADKLVSNKMTSSKVRDIINKLHEYEDILETWEKEISWDIENPLNKN